MAVSLPCWLDYARRTRSGNTMAICLSGQVVRLVARTAQRRRLAIVLVFCLSAAIAACGSGNCATTRGPGQWMPDDDGKPVFVEGKCAAPVSSRKARRP